MKTPEKYIIDSSALYAVVSDEDRFHDAAIRYYDELKNRDIEFWTTSYALSEIVALVHRRFGFDIVAQLLEIIEPSIKIYWVDDRVHSVAMAEYKAVEGRGLSLVDWTIVVVSRMMSARVFTFDAGMAHHVVDAIPRQ